MDPADQPWVLDLNVGPQHGDDFAACIKGHGAPAHLPSREMPALSPPRRPPTPGVPTTGMPPDDLLTQMFKRGKTDSPTENVALVQIMAFLGGGGDSLAVRPGNLTGATPELAIFRETRPQPTRRYSNSTKGAAAIDVWKPHGGTSTRRLLLPPTLQAAGCAPRELIRRSGKIIRPNGMSTLRFRQYELGDVGSKGKKVKHGVILFHVMDEELGFAAAVKSGPSLAKKKNPQRRMSANQSPAFTLSHLQTMADADLMTSSNDSLGAWGSSSSSSGGGTPESWSSVGEEFDDNEQWAMNECDDSQSPAATTPPGLSCTATGGGGGTSAAAGETGGTINLLTGGLLGSTWLADVPEDSRTESWQPAAGLTEEEEEEEAEAAEAAAEEEGDVSTADHGQWGAQPAGMGLLKRRMESDEPRLT